MNRPSQSIKMRGISPEEAEAITAEFHGLDRDGNGEVSVDELEAVLRSMRVKLLVSETEIKQTMRKIDSNGDGVIQLSELNGVLEKYDTKGTVYKALNMRSEIRREFKKYDSDGSGYISKDELLNIVNERTGANVTPKQLELMMKDSDTNDDGRINYEEFCEMMTKSFMKRRVFKTRSC